MAAKPLNALDAPKSLKTVNPAAWEGQPLPELRWLVDSWLLASGTTYLTGQGAVGKSLFAQQAMTCLAAGRDLLGQPVKRAAACYVTAEDDLDELHRRQHAINSSLGISFDDLGGWLHIASLKGRSAALVSFSPEMTVTELFGEIEAMIDETGVECLALDNVAHLLAGNENDRYVVSAFLGLCDHLAARMSGAVLLIGHPNKAGAEFSGSTAWENAVRSRLYLGTAKERDGYRDPDGRTLSRAKFNYGKRGQELAFRWHKGAFVRDDDLPADYAGELAHAAAIAQENARFLECLDVATNKRRNVSHANGANFAPRVFAEMPEARGMSAEALKRGMERLISTGEIELNCALWKYENRTFAKGIRRFAEGAQNSAQSPAEAPHETCAKPAHNLHNAAQEVLQNPSSPRRGDRDRL